MKPSIGKPAPTSPRGRTTSGREQAATGVQNPQRNRVAGVVKALKLDLMTAGLSIDDRDRGFDPYDSRPGRAPDIWKGSRTRR